jgi:tetratricopeptide (TPR) repeat protein
MALSPLDPGFFMYLAIAGLAHLANGRPEQALQLGKKSAALYPDWDTAYWLLVPAHVQLGNLGEAQAALARLVALTPGMTVSGTRRRFPIRNQEFLNMVLDGLRAAGLPE